MFDYFVPLILNLLSTWRGAMIHELDLQIERVCKQALKPAPIYKYKLKIQEFLNTLLFCVCFIQFYLET